MIRRLVGILSILSLLLAMMIAALLVGTRLGGLTPYGIRASDMEPVLSEGDLVFGREVVPEAVGAGMLMIFDLDEQTLIRRVTDVCVRETELEPVLRADGGVKRTRSGKLVVKAVTLDEPVRYFMTRSEALPEETVVHERNVIGVAVAAVPYAGYLVLLFETVPGRLAAAGVGLALIGMMFLPEITRQYVPAGPKKRRGIGKTDEDMLVCDRRSAQGDDLVLKAKGAREGDDIIVEEK